MIRRSADAALGDFPALPSAPSVRPDTFGNASDTDLDLQLALDLFLPLTKNWGLFARPAALDMIFGDHDTAIRYDLIVGAGLRI